MSQPAREEAQISLSSEWRMDPATQPAVINQVMFRPGLNEGNDGRPSGFYMTVGHITPPVFVPGVTEEDMATFGPIPIAMSGHYYIPLGFAEELRDNLIHAINAAYRGGRVE